MALGLAVTAIHAHSMIPQPGQASAMTGMMLYPCQMIPALVSALANFNHPATAPASAAAAPAVAYCDHPAASAAAAAGRPCPAVWLGHQAWTGAVRRAVVHESDLEPAVGT